MSENFNERLELGHRYEDFVVRHLWRRGLPTCVHQSRHYQWKAGETVNGIEIKLDRNFRKTGNLYIEISERRVADGTSEWRNCGIYELPAPRLFAIGDYQTIYVLGVRWLRVACFSCRKHEGQTSRGRLLPVLSAVQNAVDIIEIANGEREDLKPQLMYEETNVDAGPSQALEVVAEHSQNEDYWPEDGGPP